MIFVFLSLTSLSMMISRSMHVVSMSLFHSFSWLSNLCIYVPHLLYPFVDEHLGYFLDLAIVNSAAMNIGVHISFQIMVFSGYAQKWDCWII